MNNVGTHIVKSETSSIVDRLTIASIVSICQQRKYAFALYQLPGTSSKEVHAIIDLSSGASITETDIDEMDSGFVFHPFSSSDHSIRYIRKDIHLVSRSGQKGLSVRSSNIDDEVFNQIFNDDSIRTEISNSAKERVVIQPSTKGHKEQYISLVDKTVKQIKLGQFQKAVVARKKEIALPSDFSSVRFFNQLSSQYQNAFVYLVSLPNESVWIGATPETLISIDSNRRFRTTALAATQAYSEHMDLEDTTWSQKDIEEQAMVSRYIINCFKKIRLREFEEIGPRTHLSGNLVHLKTDYLVNMDQVGFPQLGSVMLKLLHPTSAVCGMPKEPALQFIQENEGFDRGYFTGYLGPVNIEDETNIFVNLRCMQVKKDQASLYAGAGIISNSNPEKEWIETEIKMETLLKVLQEL